MNMPAPAFTPTEDLIRLLLRHRRKVRADRIRPEASLTDDIGLDSLDRIELAMEIETACSVEIPETDYTSARTLRDLAALVDRIKQNQ